MARSGRASRPGAAKTAAPNPTRVALVDAAIESLRFDGFAGASARAIAARAEVNPGLIFYHFGTVADLLLAALEEVSLRRMARYSAAVEAAETPADLLAVATEIFREDLDEGYVTVLAEMIAGAGFSPGLGEQVAAVIAPWRTFAQQAIETIVSESPLAPLVPVDDAAHAVVALYLGLEMLSHLDGDREPALRLFDRASQLLTVFGATGAGSPTESHTMTLNIDGTTSGSRIDTGVDAVTGAFSYSGRSIAQRLLERGRTVRTLTGHPKLGDNANEIQVRPLDFSDLPALVRALEGVTTLYNTYWVRFAHGSTSHEQATENSRTLFHAARQAGVQRIVHVSITNPTIESPYAYFRGKALVERALAETGVSYAILRPAILFGNDGVLINNIAWLLRRLPIFAVGGRGEYRIRPIHVDDLAELCVAAAGKPDSSIIDAVGPERPTFFELVHAVRASVGSRARILRVPGALLPPLSAVLNRALHDVLLTSDEYNAMADGLADTDGPSTAPTALSDWLAEHAATLGTQYANELERHFSR